MDHVSLGGPLARRYSLTPGWTNCSLAYYKSTSVPTKPWSFFDTPVLGRRRIERCHEVATRGFVYSASSIVAAEVALKTNILPRSV